MDKVVASAVIRRFDSIIRTVAVSVASSFPSVTEPEDAEQDARLLLLAYAGLAPSQYGRGHVGRIAQIERKTGGDEDRVMRLVATQLKMDLNRYYSRETGKRLSTVPLDSASHITGPPGFDLAEAVKDEDELRRHYPTLALWLLDEMTEDAIADMAGVNVRTVERRVYKEKQAYLSRYARRHGLRVSGEETVAELQEACANLKGAGR